MDITFTPFNESHFPLMLRWLEMPHVKKWWDSDGVDTLDRVKEKYKSYTQGYKDVNGIHKSIHAYLILVEQEPVGYIQSYNAYDFPRSKPLLDLPENLAAFDIFIGEESYLNKGIGYASIRKFTQENIFPDYRYCLVDPEFKNEQAVRVYEKAGFKLFKKMDDRLWMMAYKKIVRLSIYDCVVLETVFKKYFLKDDTLWVFGSRADLSKKGGDIDLYIETNEANIELAIKRKSRFIAQLECEIGEQKIDVIFNMLNFPNHLPIYDVAKNEGVRMI